MALPMPVLLATAHRDEAAPHLHVLMLPVKDGKHIGGALIDKAKLRNLRESFFAQVAGPAGLKRDGAKVRGIVKQWAVAAVLARCEGLALPALMGPLWPVFESGIHSDPTRHLLALDIDVNTIRPPTDSPLPSPIALQQSPIALASSPIALQKQGQKTQGLSCVALHQHTTPASAPKAASDAATEPAMQPCLNALWAAVGCRSNWTTPSKAERMRRARDAQQRAIDRHRIKPAALAPAGAVHHHCETVRVRDEFAHDTTAWND
ncbi:MAG: plasmid recombination protein [Burkholderiaceae bacterium]|nr:plasmid recombination protein [Burkholderiaceae bacterium]